MKKKDLKEKVGIGNSTMTKLANNENVMVEVMTKICSALECEMDDIIEIIPEEEVPANNAEKESSHGNCSRSRIRI